ncbi:MAG: hypothetical protein AAFV25_05910 [Bacteroidota bacterium]
MKSNEPNYMDERLEELLLKADFADLSKADQAYVYDRMDAQTFEESRQALLASRRVLSESPPPLDPQIRGRLMEQMRQHHSPKSTPIRQLASRPVPLWQAVSAVAAAVALLLLFRPTVEVLVQGPPQMVYEYKTDTVFREVPIQVAMDTPNIRKAPSKVSTPRVINRNPRRIAGRMDSLRSRRPLPAPSTPSDLGFVLSANDSADFQQVIRQYPPRNSGGRPLTVDKELMHFITEIY